MDLESLNQTPDVDTKISGDADQNYTMIDPERIKQLTLIMKYFCNVNIISLDTLNTYRHLSTGWWAI